MTYDIYLFKNRNFISNCSILGKTNENKATRLEFKLPKGIFVNVSAYLDIEKPDGTKFRTTSLTILNDSFYYEVPNSILDDEGTLKIEVILEKLDGFCFKFNTITFKIVNSINAIEELEESNPTFVTKVQEIIDAYEDNGNTLGGGVTDYNDLANNPIVNLNSSSDDPIYLRDLETGVYVLNGTFRAYTGSSQNLSFIKALTTINRKSSKSYIQVIYPVSCQIQYMEITDSDRTITQIALSTMLTRIQLLEEQVG